MRTDGHRQETELIVAFVILRTRHKTQTEGLGEEAAANSIERKRMEEKQQRNTDELIRKKFCNKHYS